MIRKIDRQIDRQGEFHGPLQKQRMHKCYLLRFTLLIDTCMHAGALGLEQYLKPSGFVVSLILTGTSPQFTKLSTIIESCSSTGF